MFPRCCFANITGGTKDKTVLWAVDAKLVNRGPHLGRESEIGRGLLAFADHDAKLVHNLVFTYPLESRADKAVCNHQRIVGGQEFRNSGDPVANNVVQ